MKGFPKMVSDLVLAARRQGWTVRRTKRNHLWFLPPAGEAITVAGTPSMQGNRNDRARLRRAGLKF